MKIILTRHGETIENINGIMQGHLPGRLSQEGIDQAKKLAFRLKDEKIDVIYSSDLARAADTAREIHKYHANSPLVLTPEIREFKLGVLEGKHKSFAEDVNWDKNLIEGAETNGEARIRIKAFLDKIYKKHNRDTVCLIAHGGISTIIISLIVGKDIITSKELKNTNVCIFEITEDKNCKIHLLNCTKHLNK
ncbi:MAG: histidine phosphatase family protein [archaeon]